MTIMTNKKQEMLRTKRSRQTFPLQTGAFWAILQANDQPNVYTDVTRGPSYNKKKKYLKKDEKYNWKLYTSLEAPHAELKSTISLSV